MLVANPEVFWIMVDLIDERRQAEANERQAKSLQSRFGRR